MADDPKNVKLGMIYNSSESERKPFPEINQIRTFVQKELIRRRESASDPRANDLKENSFVPSTPFVKLTACAEIKGQGNFLTLGLHGYNGDPLNTFETMYGREEFIGYTYSNGGQVKVIVPDSVANGAYPPPGITGATINRAMIGQPFTAVINWTCYTQKQLEFLRNYFATPGLYLVFEWGHKSIENSTQFSPLDFSNGDIINRLVDNVDVGRERQIDDILLPARGNYDYIVGQTSDFSITIGANNSYNCSTSIMSIGEATYGIKSEESHITTNDTIDLKQTVSEYFHLGGRLDSIIQDDKNNEYVADTNTLNSGKIDINRDSKQSLQMLFGKLQFFTADDAIYIDWKFINDTIFPELMDVLSNSSNKKFHSVMKLPQPDNPITGPFIGKSKWLQSINPEIMIISSEQHTVPPKENKNVVLSGGAADRFDPSETLDNSVQQKPEIEDKIERGRFQGLLSKGVWINIYALQQSFLETLSFYDGIVSLLNKMSQATGGFWNLQLYFDDYKQQYYIVDTHRTEIPLTQNFYSFNEGPDSELFSLEFNVTYTNSEKSMISLSLQSELPQNRTGQTNVSLKLIDPPVADLIRIAQKKRVDAQNDTSIGVKSQTFEEQVLDLDTRIGKARHAAALSNLDRLTVGFPASLATKGPQDPGERRSSSLIRPVTGVTTSNFGWRTIDGKRDYHDGLDMRARVGTPVKSISDGIIRKSGRSDGKGAGGNYITVEYVNGVFVDYMHLSEKIIGQPETPVAAGQVIAKSGESGVKGNPHLHIQVYTINKDGSRTFKDPEKWMAGGLVSAAAATIKTTSSKTIPASTEMVANSTLAKIESVEALQKERDKLLDDWEKSSKNDLWSTAKRKFRWGETTKSKAEQEKRAEIFKKEKEDANEYMIRIKTKFGSRALTYICPNPSFMKKKIAKEGEDNPGEPNAYNFPYMTQINSSFVIKGISGLSAGDAFYIDKLPSLYKEYGVFQIIGTEDIIGNEGWVTKVNSQWKAVWVGDRMNRAGF